MREQTSAGAHAIWPSLHLAFENLLVVLIKTRVQNALYVEEAEVVRCHPSKTLAVISLLFRRVWLCKAA